MNEKWREGLLGGVLRDLAVANPDQRQTRDTFGFKWSKRETYQSGGMRSVVLPWLQQRYAPLLEALKTFESKPLILDAGCGAGHAASMLFDGAGNSIRYVGADISTAIDIAHETLAPILPDSLFMQGDLMELPFEDRSFDVVFSEGVLHHTPSTKRAIAATARLVREGGYFAIYVYNKKGPVREFTDDYIRERISELPAQEGWEALLPLTRLGKALGELKVEVDVPEAVPLLGIPEGRLDVQRLFYWYVCKLFYRPELTLDEMNHINFDWFMPKFSHRQTPDEVRNWCEEAGLDIESLNAEEAGITVIARRRAEKITVSDR